MLNDAECSVWFSIRTARETLLTRPSRKKIVNLLWKKDEYPNVAESLILMGLTAVFSSRGIPRVAPGSSWGSLEVSQLERIIAFSL